MSDHRALAFAGALLAASSPELAWADDKKVCADAYETGQAMRDAGRLTEARGRLTKCASEDCPAVLRGDCIEWLRQVDARLPTIVLRVVDANEHDVVAASVVPDGGAPGPVDGRPIPLDPGHHVLRVTAGPVSVDEDVIVAEGEKDRMVVVHLRASEPPTPRSPAPIAPTGAPGPTSSRYPRAAFVVGGVGVAAFGVATYFYVRGFEDGSTLVDRCGTPPTCPRSETDAAHAKLIVGDLLAGVGVACMVVASYLLLTHRSTPSTSILTPHGVRATF